MKLINSTHFRKYLTTRRANDLFKVLIRNFKTKRIKARFDAVRQGKETGLTFMLRHVEIEDILERKDWLLTRKDGEEILRIIDLIIQDDIKYEGKIPDTSDCPPPEKEVIDDSVEFFKQRDSLVKSRKKRQREFVKRFKKMMM